MQSRRDFLGALAAAPVAAQVSKPPNIVVILADDLGFSDLGCYGGEIATPNLDRLAAGGVRFTQFYNAARCCPSRASLMTGLYPHQAGMGAMTSPRPGPLAGYQGRLNNHCVTIPEMLRESGYTTLMSGKWHLGAPGPIERGFDEYYGMVHGFDSFWDASKYTRLPADRPQRSYSDGQFYATNAITDHALDFVGAARRGGKPYFLYLAYNAPHFPLHAPKDVIDKYMPVYEQGWDKIRERRWDRLKDLKLVDPAWDFPPRSVIPPNRVATPHGWADKQNPAWADVESARRKDLARRMAVYAAMVDVMDQNIGRVISDLRTSGELDNTLILFLSDNGACAEWDPWGFDVRSGPDNTLHQGAALDLMGQPGTYHSYGSGWANACATPFRLYKHYNHEGGITTPFIAHWPKGITRRGAIEHQSSHLIDILPTCRDVGRAKYPDGDFSNAIQPAEGASLVQAFQGAPLAPRALYWEHEGNRAMRKGDWKITAVGPDGPWELYNMQRDRTEMRDLASSNPIRVASMAATWDAWARSTNAVPWPWAPARDPEP
jgi:arylsulfatase